MNKTFRVIRLAAWTSAGATVTSVALCDALLPAPAWWPVGDLIAIAIGSFVLGALLGVGLYALDAHEQRSADRRRQHLQAQTLAWLNGRHQVVR